MVICCLRASSAENSALGKDAIFRVVDVRLAKAVGQVSVARRKRVQVYDGVAEGRTGSEVARETCSGECCKVQLRMCEG